MLIKEFGLPLSWLRLFAKTTTVDLAREVELTKVTELFVIVELVLFPNVESLDSANPTR